MNPRCIVIVRHAEKPTKKKDIGLSTFGRMRAMGLSKILAKLTPITPTQIPDYIFACKATKESNRPAFTIHPTATRFKLKINQKFADKDVKGLVRELSKKKYRNKLILICWHHGTMPKLIKKLGFKSPYKKWPENLFDRIITLYEGFNDEAVVFNDPQRLLFTDSEN
jgi:hypothetical protein